MKIYNRTQVPQGTCRWDSHLHCRWDEPGAEAFRESMSAFLIKLEPGDFYQIVDKTLDGAEINIWCCADLTGPGHLIIEGLNDWIADNNITFPLSPEHNTLWQLTWG